MKSHIYIVVFPSLNLIPSKAFQKTVSISVKLRYKSSLCYFPENFKENVYLKNFTVTYNYITSWEYIIEHQLS